MKCHVMFKRWMNALVVGCASACVSPVSAKTTGDAHIAGTPNPTFCRSATLLANDGAADDLFGNSVSVFGNIALVGAPGEGGNGPNSGSAYLFRWNGASWVEEQKLVPNDGAAGDSFGNSVSVSGDVALIGAVADSDNGPDSGSAYVFRWNGAAWVQEAKLLPDDGSAGDQFGASVSVSGDVALIGAPQDDDFLLSSGSAYTFRWNQTAWVQEPKLLPSDGAPLDFFGDAVSVSGDVALIGAGQNDDAGASSGSAYVFRWNGTAWVEELRLLPSDGAPFNFFGTSVSVSGNVALVGASGSVFGGISGSAYTFRWNGTDWVEEQKLLAGDGAANDHFGTSVSVSGDIALIGANLDDDNGADSGSAYVFRWDGTTWVQDQQLFANDGAALDSFGNSVSVSGDVVLVGAHLDDDNGLDSGSAFVFSSAAGPDCNSNGILDACDIASGTSRDSDADGIPDICTDFCELPTLLADDGEMGNSFGLPVYISDDLFLVGASGDDNNGANSGSAYVFRRDGTVWVQEQKLLASDGAAGDSFGRSASLSGDVALFGASGNDDNGANSGSAYVFRWNGTAWIQEQKLLPIDGAAGDVFGGSVSVFGDVVLVGAPWNGDNGWRSGAAYTFRWNGIEWVQEPRLLPFDGTAGDEFGSSVSVFGDVALIGAGQDDGSGTASGSAYVFRWDGTAWFQEQKLLPSDLSAGDGFGLSVSLSGDVALIGAFSDNNKNGVNAGSAYVFRWNGTAWVEEQKLLAEDGTGSDLFGSVSISGDVALVGARFHAASGAAYVFRWNGSTWTQDQKLLAQNGAPGDRFGSSVSVSGDVALVGAFTDDDNGTDSGSARVFSIGVTDCNLNDVFDACDIGAGDSGDCNSNGVPDDCEIPQDCIITGMCPVVSTWIGESGLWDDLADNRDWCLPEAPNNNPNATFDVLIDGPTALAVLNTSPTINLLSLMNEAVVQVDDQSGANVRTLSVDGPIISGGIFRAMDRERLVLDAPVIDQMGECEAGGVLEAADGIAAPGEENDKSILEINGARILGGVARTIGDHSEIHLIGGAELVGVCIDGVVVPDGQSGGFSGTVTNDDVFTIRGVTLDTRFGPTADNAVLDSATGAGCVRMASQAHAMLGDFFDSFTNGANHRIDGAGLVFGGVTNLGVIEANGPPDEALILSAPGVKTNAGVLRAISSGRLRLESLITQTDTGIIMAAAGGVVEINENVDGAGGLIAFGGTVQVNNSTVTIGCTDVPPPVAGMAGSVEVVGGTLASTAAGAPNDLRIRGGTVAASLMSTVNFAGPVTICPEAGFPAALDLANSTFAAGTLDVCPGGQVTFVDSTLTVHDNLSFANTIEGDWSLAGSSALAITGGVGSSDVDPAAYAQLESGGEDLGTDPVNHVGDPAGFIGNFALPKLIIGPGAHVSLFDRVDNGNRVDHGFGTDESLYVETLEFADATGRLNINGLHLYFDTLVGNSAQIIDLPRLPGDFDTDGDRDMNDVARFQRCFGEAAADHGCRVFDSDGNGAIELLDLSDFAMLLDGPG